MNKEEIERQLNNVMKACETYAGEAAITTGGQIDSYGFKVSIGSYLGKIKAELENLPLFKCMDCEFVAGYSSSEFMEHRKEKHWRGFVPYKW